MSSKETKNAIPKIRARRGDVAECILTARAFYDIANKCYLESLGGVRGNLAYPVAVNLAFSCGLHIKAIMMSGSPSSEFRVGHKLDDLYGYLEHEDRGAIAGLCAGRLHEEVETTLESLSDVFERGRYSFEEGYTLDVRIDDLSRLAEILEEYAKTAAKP